uniref:Uncharacterized protein n=1 Tax=Ascaris lumbricoides TaxID=6252 RepID=A0A0M3HZ80_ASCLU
MGKWMKDSHSRRPEREKTMMWITNSRPWRRERLKTRKWISDCRPAPTKTEDEETDNKLVLSALGRTQ